MVTTRLAGWDSIRTTLVNDDARFEEARLDSLVPQEAAGFVHKLYPVLDPQGGAAAAERLVTEVVHERWREDWELATNP
jgi:hypothetical protein